MKKNNSKKYPEVEKIDILSEKAKGFFANLNHFEYDQNLLDFKKDIDENLVMSGQEISDDVSSFLTFLVSYLKPKKVLELGTFAGFSTLIIARACPEGFNIKTVDVNNDPVSIGKKYWQKEGFEDSINFIQGRAYEVVKEMNDVYDFIFIDADKKGTSQYLKQALSVLGNQGMIVVDNMWLNGAVLDPKREMHFSRIEFIDEIKKMDDINYNFLPIGDGLLVVTKSFS